MELTEEDADRMDEYFGPRTYEKWSPINAVATSELARAKRADKALWSYDHAFAVLSPYGTDYVEKAQLDFFEAILMMREGKYPDPKQFAQLYEILDASLEAADVMLEEAEAIPTVALLNGAMQAKVLLIGASAGKLRKKLMDLDELLHEAEAEAIGVEIKAAFAFVAGTVELLIPGVGILAKGSAALMEIILAESRGKEAMVKGTKMSLETVEWGIEKIRHRSLGTVEEIEKIGHRTQTFAKYGARGITVVGLWLEWSEVKEARHKVSEIQQLMKEAKTEYDHLVELLRNALPALVAAQQHLSTLMKPYVREAEQRRSTRDQLISKYSYPIIRPWQWRVFAEAPTAQKLKTVSH
jgi:hypothetical protein